MFARSWQVLLVAAALVFTGCTSSTTQTASNSPEQTPSQASSPSTSPSSSPSSSPSATESPTSTPSAAGGPLTIKAPSFHTGEVGVSYAPIGFAAAGGTAPYAFTLTGGSLPGGLGLSGGGAISGTPNAAGKPSFTVTVTDSVGGTASAAGAINVVAHLSVTQPCANLCSVEAGCTVCGAFGSASGGAGPLSYKVTQGGPPPTMKVSGLTLTGAFPGGGTGAYNIAVLVTDQLGVQQTVAGSWYVFGHVAFGVGSALCGPGYGCQVSIPYKVYTPNNGTVTISFSNIVCGNPPCTGVAPEPAPNKLPASMGYSDNGSAITIQFASPGSAGDWVGHFNLTITDTSLCGPGSAHCSTTIVVTVDSERRFG